MSLLAALILLLSLKAIQAAPTLEPHLLSRTDVCGGDSSLAQCGGSFPTDFCCPHSSICLPLNVTGAIATVCCPPGVDCLTIQPTTCEQGAYNATTAAANQVHVSPIMSLASCGSACCPAGYTCQGERVCVANNATVSSTKTSLASTQSLPPSSATASASAIPAASDSSPSKQVQAVNSSSFSGSSFAAGFVPGIALGMIVIAAISWCIRRKSRAHYNGEKAYSQDQLTGLSPIESQQQPQTHMRSISEPTMMLNSGHRTDFLRSSPSDSTQTSDDKQAQSFDTIEEEDSKTSNPYEPKPMFQFSPSIRHPRSPLPSHMKRGTLSYSISPIRQLRSKKSVHSLRRYATSPVRSDSQRQRSSVVRSNTSSSTETIQVLMTPDQRPSYIDPASHDRSHPPSSVYTSKQPWTTPTRLPNNPQPAVLGSPYSYQPRDNVESVHLEPDVPSRSRRVTTFSSLMERAGLRKEDLM